MPGIDRGHHNAAGTVREANLLGERRLMVVGYVDSTSSDSNNSNKNSSSWNSSSNSNNNNNSTDLLRALRLENDKLGLGNRETGPQNRGGDLGAVN